MMHVYPKNQSHRSISVIQANDLPSKQDPVMTPEQFTQVFEAILDGKYSWACVLTLKFAGYNPLHYIPYRTYKRLLKDNAPSSKKRSQPVPDAPELGAASVTYTTHLNLNCPVDRPENRVHSSVFD
jgi:hypothetical protein